MLKGRCLQAGDGTPLADCTAQTRRELTAGASLDPWPAEHPTLGPVSVNGNAVNIDGVPKGVRNVTPDMGEYTDELLADLGYDATAIAALSESGAI